MLELAIASEHSKELKSFRFKPNTLMKEIFIKALIGGGKMMEGNVILACFAFDTNYC